MKSTQTANNSTVESTNNFSNKRRRIENSKFTRVYSASKNGSIENIERVKTIGKKHDMSSFVNPSKAILDNIVTRIKQIESDKKENMILTDILNQKIKSKNLRYIKFKTFLDSHQGLNVKNGLLLINSNIASKKQHSRNDFKNGNLEITNLTKLNSYMKTIDKTKKYFSDYYNIKFIKAFVSIWELPNYDNNKMLKHLKSKIVIPKIGVPRIKTCDSVDEYKEMLLNIYNYYSPDKNRLSF